MKRSLLAALAVLTLTSQAPAAILQFIGGTVPDDDNPLTVIGDGIFEVSDTPNPAPNTHQFPVVSAFDVEVIADDGAGSTFPVTFTLDRLSTTNDHVNLIFTNPTYNQLFVSIDVPGTLFGDPLPGAPIEDADGIVNWNAPSLASPSESLILAGSLEGAHIIAVPEPSSLALIGLGMLGLFSIRRTK